MMARRLAGKTAIVTGGESGIGEAIVRLFLLEGASVLAAGVQVPLLESLARELGIDARFCDVSDAAAVTATLEHAVRMTGRLDIVVNAAGIMHADNVADIEGPVWERLLAVNLTGAMRVCRAAIPAMMRAGAGVIVNISSVAAFNGSAGMASYATGKAGLVALTRALANEYGQHGIRANCLCPGWVRTPMSEQEMIDIARSRACSVDEAFASLTDRIALRRIAAPAEIARCALFLASDDASFVTGTTLIADGGARTPASARGI